MRSEPRYVVTELEGFDTATSTGVAKPGLSTHVLDTAYNHRLMATWRTEDYGGTRLRRVMIVRQRAADYASYLNAGLRPPPPPARHIPRNRAEVCPNGHPKSPENVYVEPHSGHRQCRECRRAAQLRADLKRGMKRRAI